jgi:hypothetical protein
VEGVTFRYYEALIALAVLGAVFTIIRRERLWIWPVLSLPVLLTLCHLFFHAKDRFHMPIDGVIAPLAAVALVEAANLARRLASSARRDSPAIVHA